MKTRLLHLSAFAFTASLILIIASCHSDKQHCDAYGSSTSGSGRINNYSSNSAVYNSGPVNVPSNGVLDGVYVQQNISTKRMIPYEYVREADMQMEGERKVRMEDDGLEVNRIDDGGKPDNPLTRAKGSVPDVATAYERYNPYQENVWVDAGHEAKSTFGIDVDNASYTNFRRFVNNDQLPPKDAIRMEEWLNFFNYEIEAPAESDAHPVKITTELADCPWNEEDELLMVKLQGKRIPQEKLPPSNLVFLVDVSGSMNARNKLPLVQETMIELIDKLRPEDHMSIVTYAGTSGVVLEPTSGSDKKKIKSAVNNLKSGGATAGSEGVNTAYKLAERNYLEDGNNRVIVATDGDWNIGVTNNGGLKSLIEKKRKSGIFLSVLGFGMGNLNDAMMEMLADNGNGNYAYIDSKKEATRIFDSEFTGSMYVIAKDVKLQMQFDSTVVDQYRLIGYENRVLENWQFEADSIDAGDLGVGQNVVAFYQIKRKEGQNRALGKIDFRYKPLKSEISTLLSTPITTHSNETSSDYKYASCVVEFALALRESEYRDNANMSEAILRGKQNLGDKSDKLSYEKRVEFVGLMEETASMWEGYVIEDAPDITVDHFPELKLYPNPASIEATVAVPDELSNSWSVQIFAMTGELKKIQHFRESVTGKLELTDLPPGTYMIKVYSEGMNFGYLRLVVQ